jgi:uncharacterized membrane protein
MKFAADFRQTARNALKNRWGIAILAGFIAALLGGTNTSGGSINLNFITTSSESSGSGTPLNEEQLALILGVLSFVVLAALAIGLVLFIVGSVVAVGYSKFNLALIDGEEATIGTLFSYFSQFGRILLTQLLRLIYTFLWSLLFIIPGIVATYKYAMVPYILAENPDITPSQAIEMSKRMMEGNKWRLFCLEMSFIGWSILAVLTCGIGSFVLLPYMEAARADFYREVSGTRKPPVMYSPMGANGYYPPSNQGYYQSSGQGYYPNNQGYNSPDQQNVYPPRDQGYYPPNDNQGYTPPSDQGYQPPSNDDTQGYGQ